MGTAGAKFRNFTTLENLLQRAQKILPCTPKGHLAWRNINNLFEHINYTTTDCTLLLLRLRDKPKPKKPALLKTTAEMPTVPRCVTSQPTSQNKQM